MSLYFFSDAYKSKDYRRYLRKLNRNVLLDLRFRSRYYGILLNENLEKIQSAMNDAYLKSNNIQSGIMDTFASVISNNLNIVMKQLASISIILMIPTLVASLYGMNVPNFMENSKLAFPAVLGISGALAVTGVILFRKRKWF